MVRLAWLTCYIEMQRLKSRSKFLNMEADNQRTGQERLSDNEIGALPTSASNVVNQLVDVVSRYWQFRGGR